MNRTILITSVILIFLILAIVALKLITPKNTGQKPPVNIPTASNLPSSSESPGGPGTLNLFSSYPRNNDANVPLNSVISFTLNESANKDNYAVSINPALDFNFNALGNTLLITPKLPLNKNSTYSVTLTPKNTNLSYSISFTTAPESTNSGSIAPDEKSIQAGEDYVRTNRPDIYLTNKMPYSSSLFSIDKGGFKETPVGHYSFVVTLKGDQQQAKNALISWLKSLNLTDNQIQNLDISYQ